MFLKNNIPPEELCAFLRLRVRLLGKEPEMDQLNLKTDTLCTITVPEITLYFKS